MTRPIWGIGFAAGDDAGAAAAGPVLTLGLLDWPHAIKPIPKTAA
nr:hypothetical protein [uncultured Rhodoferax sp.]